MKTKAVRTDHPYLKSWLLSNPMLPAPRKMNKNKKDEKKKTNKKKTIAIFLLPRDCVTTE